MTHKSNLWKGRSNKNYHLIVKCSSYSFHQIFVTVLALLFSFATMATASEQEVIKGNALFTNDLYKVLSKAEGNVFFSPISAHVALSMILQGAQESTLESLTKTLRVPNNTKTVAEGYQTMMTRLNNVENVTLLMANKVYSHNSVKFLQDFNSALTKYFLTELQTVDFGKGAEAAKTINTWVEEKTKNKIKNLIDPNELNENTRLVLVNAIYFKGEWKNKFKKERTKSEPFYLNENDKINVQMMHIKSKFNYKEDDQLNAKILQLPYVNKDLSMVIILPNEKNGIKDLEMKMVDFDLSSITNNMRHVEVNVAIPRFKIETSIDLGDALTELGLGVIFDQKKANFTGMVELKPTENVYVSKVIQKAFIEVNEEGAEAAAATGVVMMMRTSFPRPIVDEKYFIADHPFLFVLMESNNPLFFGKIMKPTE